MGKGGGIKVKRNAPFHPLFSLSPCLLTSLELQGFLAAGQKNASTVRRPVKSVKKFFIPSKENVGATHKEQRPCTHCKRSTLAKYAATRSIAHITVYNKHKHNHRCSHPIPSPEHSYYIIYYMYTCIPVSVLIQHSYYIFTSLVQCCFTSTETIRLIRDGGIQHGHLDFHTAPELSVKIHPCWCCGFDCYCFTAL